MILGPVDICTYASSCDTIAGEGYAGDCPTGCYNEDTGVRLSWGVWSEAFVVAACDDVVAAGDWLNGRIVGTCSGNAAVWGDLLSS